MPIENEMAKKFVKIQIFQAKGKTGFDSVKV